MLLTQRVQPGSGQLVIFIEGDGSPWVDGGRSVASDPSPKSAVALDLASGLRVPYCTSADLLLLWAVGSRLRSAMVDLRALRGRGCKQHGGGREPFH